MLWCDPARVGCTENREGPSRSARGSGIPWDEVSLRRCALPILEQPRRAGLTSANGTRQGFLESLT